MRVFIRKYYIIAFIVLFAFFLRVYYLGNVPSGFQGDEASFFLNAQAIKLNGRDEDNNFLPLFLRSFIDPKPALYSYLQIPAIYMFGTNTFSARLPAVLLGVASILLSYILISQFVDRKYALLTIILLAISPWHINISRGTQEVIMSFAFGIGALCVLVKYIKNKQTSYKLFMLFIILLFLSMYSYHSAKIFLLLLIIPILFFNMFSKNIKKIHAIMIMIITLSVFVATSIIGGFERYNAVSIFNNPEVQLVLEDKIRAVTGSAPELVIRIFNNKVIDFAISIIRNYLDYYSAEFLFISGGMPERNKIPFHGLLYIFEGIFMIAGIYYGLSIKKYRIISLLFLYWFFIAPVPAAITSQEIPSTIRSFFMILPIYFFISIGILKIYSRITLSLYKKSYVSLIVLLYTGGLLYFMFQYFVLAPHYRPWYRNYGNSILPDIVSKYYDNYEKIYISTNQYAYFALNDFIKIKDIQTSYPKRLQMNSTYGKIEFINSDCNIFQSNKKILFVIKHTCADYTKEGKFKLVETIDFKDGNPEYMLYEQLR